MIVASAALAFLGQIDSARNCHPSNLNRFANNLVFPNFERFEARSTK
jgi:hypothetical protein